MAGKRTLGQPDWHNVFGHPTGRRKTSCRAGLYARVSTHDQQTLPLQTRTMREYAARRGWSIVIQVREVGSGAERDPDIRCRQRRGVVDSIADHRHGASVA